MSLYEVAECLADAFGFVVVVDAYAFALVCQACLQRFQFGACACSRCSGLVFLREVR